MEEGKSNPEIAVALKKWSVDELIAAGEAVEAIEESPAYQTIARVFAECRDGAYESLVIGKGSESLGAINKQLGLAQGLGILPDVIATVREKAEIARAARQAAAERADAERQAST